jgi:hypothetical protein
MSRHYVVYTPRREWDDNPEGQQAGRNRLFGVHRSHHRLDQQGCLSLLLAGLMNAARLLFLAAVILLITAALVVLLVLLLRSA